MSSNHVVPWWPSLRGSGRMLEYATVCRSRVSYAWGPKTQTDKADSADPATCRHALRLVVIFKPSTTTADLDANEQISGGARDDQIPRINKTKFGGKMLIRDE